MKLIDGIKEKGNPFLIPDCPRSKLPEFFKEMGYKVGAEIGVYLGEFTEKFCKENIKMSAVDPWLAYSGTGRTFKHQELQDSVYDQAKARLAPYDCTLIRQSSMDAVKNFADGSLDFVYIDGDHRFRYVAEDIFEWAPKVRSGGIVSGHDYYNTIPQARNVICQVGTVVDAYLKTFGIGNFYIFGGTNDPEDRYDKYYSWLWIKQ